MADGSYWTTKALSRRRVVRSAALGSGGIALALVGCGGGTTTPAAKNTKPGGTGAPSAAANAGTPKRGGTFVVPSSANLLGTTDLDPHTAANTPVMGIWQSISRGLMQIDAKTNAPVPDLAKSVEIVDPLHMTFTLPDAKWENKDPVNGRALTANDVKFSLDRIRSTQPGFTRASTIAALDRTEVVDDKHLTLVLKRPSVSFAYGLAFGLNVIVAPEVVAKYKDLKSPQAAIGVGPFAIESFEPNVQLTVARRPDSWMGDRPYVDKVKYINLLDTAATVAAYRSAQIHTITVPPDQVDQFKREFPKHTFQSFGGVSRGSFTLRLDGTAPWAMDQRVRQALSFAIDREEAVQVVFSGAGQQSGTLPAVFVPFATPPDVLATLPGYQKDMNAARANAVKLLQAAGQDKLTFSLLSSSTTTTHTAIAQFVQASLKRVGVTVNLDLIEYTSYKKRVDDMNWVTSADAYTSGYNPDEHLRQYAFTKGSRNYGGYSNKDYDKLVDQADQEFDANKRADLMHQAQKLTINDVDHIWVGTAVSMAASHPFVKNYVPTGEYPQTWRWDQLWMDNAS